MKISWSGCRRRSKFKRDALVCSLLKVCQDNLFNEVIEAWTTVMHFLYICDMLGWRSAQFGASSSRTHVIRAFMTQSAFVWVTISSRTLLGFLGLSFFIFRTAIDGFRKFIMHVCKCVCVCVIYFEATSSTRSRATKTLLEPIANWFYASIYIFLFTHICTSIQIGIFHTLTSEYPPELDLLISLAEEY